MVSAQFGIASDHSEHTNAELDEGPESRIASERNVESSDNSEGEVSDEDYREEVQDYLTLQHGEGEHARVLHSNLCLDYLCITTLVMRVCLRYGDVCILDLIEFIDELDLEGISIDQLESYIQTLFQNDDTDMASI